MSLKIDHHLRAQQLLPAIERLFQLSAEKLHSIQRSWDPARGTPVFTVKGTYTSRGWTEWTQGFQFGSALLQFDATSEKEFLELARRATIDHMAPHVSHVGVHDHGFNNVSTYGNLWRLMREGKINSDQREKDFYELALKLSGAIQAARWTDLSPAGSGYIYSFNGPHSLFIDTMRSLRSLAVAHQLRHVLMGERDRRISLLQRLLAHAASTARFNIFYGEGRDAYDVPGRTAHECIFNLNDGSYRCPNSQQGYSPFSTWTRGLAWAILGFAEQLEFLQYLGDSEIEHALNRGPANSTNSLSVASVNELMLRAAEVTAEFYLKSSCNDGIPYWDTGAPNLCRLDSALEKAADPFNRWEPVDSSAAVIAAQGLLRLGNHLSKTGAAKRGKRFKSAGLTIARSLFEQPYLSTNSRHQGLLLHSVYHRPNGWDYIARGQKVPNGESSMWGDYHARELGLLLLREAKSERYLTFFAAG
jgi:unsaturated chondroitin disaccharide hydrolase